MSTDLKAPSALLWKSLRVFNLSHWTAEKWSLHNDYGSGESFQQPIHCCLKTEGRTCETVSFHGLFSWRGVLKSTQGPYGAFICNYFQKNIQCVSNYLIFIQYKFKQKPKEELNMFVEHWVRINKLNFTPPIISSWFVSWNPLPKNSFCCVFTPAHLIQLTFHSHWLSSGNCCKEAALLHQRVCGFGLKECLCRGRKRAHSFHQTHEAVCTQGRLL